jgi:hypothetical protein
MHYRARAYSPRQMRFVQNDPPVGNRPALHYAYVRNRPVELLDYYGTQDDAIVSEAIEKACKAVAEANPKLDPVKDASPIGTKIHAELKNTLPKDKNFYSGVGIKKNDKGTWVYEYFNREKPRTKGMVELDIVKFKDGKVPKVGDPVNGAHFERVWELKTGQKGMSTAQATKYQGITGVKTEEVRPKYGFAKYLSFVGKVALILAISSGVALAADGEDVEKRPLTIIMQGLKEGREDYVKAGFTEWEHKVAGAGLPAGVVLKFQQLSQDTLRDVQGEFRNTESGK